MFSNPAQQSSNKPVKVKLYRFLVKQYAMKAYGGVEV
jgi:hypothetical protein